MVSFHNFSLTMWDKKLKEVYGLYPISSDLW